MRSRRPRAATAKQIHQRRPGRPASGRSMSSVMRWSAGSPSIQGASVEVCMPHLLQVMDAGPGAELLEDAIGPRAPPKPRDAAVRVGQIAELDGARREGLRAGGLDVAVGEPPAGARRVVLGGLNALNAQA